METVKVPTDATLKRHGLDVASWGRILQRQGFACGICGKVPKSRILNIDHQHVRGYKDMPAEQKRRYHRGLLCFQCNRHIVSRVATPAKLRAGAEYLEAYEVRKAELA